MQTTANLEFVKGTSNKFWTITLEGKNITRTWGRKGTKGQPPKVDTFPNEYLAAADYSRKLKAQLRQGYLQVEAVTADPRTTLTKKDERGTWVWSIRQDGHKLYINHGVADSNGSSQSIRCPDKAAASVEYQRRLSEKLAAGYQSIKTGTQPAKPDDSSSSKSSDMLTNLAGKRVRRLKGERKVVIKLQYSAFDQFVEDMLGQEFSFVSDQECGNDSDHEIHGSGKLSDFELESVEQFIEDGSGSYLSSDLLNYFVHKGWLEAGTYLIAVCW
jgi:predicted DNA-binding WGR domain protein